MYSNFYGNETTITLDEIEGFEILLSNYQDTKVQKTICLRPYESIVLYKRA